MDSHSVTGSSGTVVTAVACFTVSMAAATLARRGSCGGRWQVRSGLAARRGLLVVATLAFMAAVSQWSGEFASRTVQSAAAHVAPVFGAVSNSGDAVALDGASTRCAAAAVISAFHVANSSLVRDDRAKLSSRVYNVETGAEAALAFDGDTLVFVGGATAWMVLCEFVRLLLECPQPISNPTRPFSPLEVAATAPGTACDDVRYSVPVPTSYERAITAPLGRVRVAADFGSATSALTSARVSRTIDDLTTTLQDGGRLLVLLSVEDANATDTDITALADVFVQSRAGTAAATMIWHVGQAGDGATRRRNVVLRVAEGIVTAVAANSGARSTLLQLHGRSLVLRESLPLLTPLHEQAFKPYEGPIVLVNAMWAAGCAHP